MSVALSAATGTIVAKRTSNVEAAAADYGVKNA